jgi:hypothetical protein
MPIGKMGCGALASRKRRGKADALIDELRKQSLTAGLILDSPGVRKLGCGL